MAAVSRLRPTAAERAAQAAVAREEEHLTRLQALTAQTLEVLHAAQRDAATAATTARADLEAVKPHLDLARRDRSRLEAEALALRAEVASLQPLLEQVRSLREELDTLHGLVSDARAEHEALSGAAAELQATKEQHARLRAEVEALEATHRPLLPYVPPQDRPKLTAAPAATYVRLERLDHTALRLYAERDHTTAVAVVTLGLRNVIPHETYTLALEQLVEEARADLAPANGG